MKNLKHYRIANGYTQHQLAVALGTTQQAIARWESKELSPVIDLLCDIACFFNVGTDDILGINFFPEESK